MPANDKGEKLVHAAGSGDLELVKSILRESPSILDYRSIEYGYTPINEAARNGNLEIVQHLFELNANMNVRSKMGALPVYNAAMNGFHRVVMWLLKNGSDINAQTNIGRTPLIIATRSSFNKMAKDLLDMGADKDLEDDEGNTALMHALEVENNTLINLLREGEETPERDIKQEQQSIKQYSEELSGYSWEENLRLNTKIKHLSETVEILEKKYVDLRRAHGDLTDELTKSMQIIQSLKDEIKILKQRDARSSRPQASREDTGTQGKLC